MSDDAVPALISRFDALSPEQQCVVAKVLAMRTESGDIRSWNLSRQTASRLVQAHPEVQACR